MPTENEAENRDEWVDQQATVVKVEDDRYLIHSAGLVERDTFFLTPLLGYGGCSKTP